MFRELTRSRKSLPETTCIQLLKTEKRGVLSVIGLEGYPYGMPIHHYYREQDGCLYFHCGRQKSHRLDALKQCDRVSFCVYDGGTQEENHWALRVQSVIVFGTIEVVDDPALIQEIGTALSRKFTSDEAYILQELQRSGPATLLLHLTPAHISGKWVTEA